MTQAPTAAERATGLQQMLGADGAARLRRILLSRAATWAETVAPGRVHVAVAPGGHRAELSELVGGASVFDQGGGGLGHRVGEASTRVLEADGGPLLIVGTATPVLSRAHARAALDDLAEGCDVSLGPTTQGGCFLLALAGPQPAIGRLDEADDDAAQPLLARALAASAGLRLGLLRSERSLITEADARALLADPLAPGDVCEALRSYVRDR